MDYLIFHTLNDFVGKHPLFDLFTVFIAEYLGYILVLILFLYFLKESERYKAVLIKALSAAIFARFVIVEIIRFFWDRPRPFVGNHINYLLKHSASPSFPSGHAAFFFGFSTIVYFYNKKAGIWFLFASLLISIFRVYGGVHWPSDVVVGALVGIVSAYFINVLSAKLKIFN